MMIKRLISERLVAVAGVFFLGVATKAAATFPIQLDERQLPLNLQSQAGVALSTSPGAPSGSNGMAPTSASQIANGLTQNAPSAGQFRSFVAIGGVAPAASQTLNAQGSGQSGWIQHRVLVGMPYFSRQVNFHFGAIITPPNEDETGAPLLAGIRPQDYWRDEPLFDSALGPKDLGFYFSPSARRVFAVEVGEVQVTWLKFDPESSDPADKSDSTKWYESGGKVYRKYSKTYVISGVAAKAPRKIFFNSGSPADVPQIKVPSNVSQVNIVYTKNFPETVGAIPDSGPIPSNRTLWFENGFLYARNIEGRVLVELVDAAGKHLGYEIVDVIKKSVPDNVTVLLGERVSAWDPALGRDDSHLTPGPGAANSTFAYTERVSSSRSVYYATRPTNHPGDYSVFWMETGEQGMQWPARHVEYILKWPSDPTAYVHYVRPEVASEAEAKETAVLSLARNAVHLQYQDTFADAPALGGKLDSFRYYSYLDRAHPSHRALMRYHSGEGVAFERVFSWLEPALEPTTTFGFRSPAAGLSIFTPLGNGLSGSLDWKRVPETLQPRVVRADVEVGDRIKAPPSELGAGPGEHYWAGMIVAGDAYWEDAYIDPLTNGQGFERANLGAIIPVNAIPGKDTLKVYWFRRNRLQLSKGFHAAYWPSVVGHYAIRYPANPKKIILASNHGTGPLSSEEARGSIYRQPDKGRIGYNPNEEHGILLGGTGFALRDDLNLLGSTAETYTSEPYVLIQYTAADGRPAMNSFKVERTSPEFDFTFLLDAGTPIQAPMPLPLLPLPTFSSDEAAIGAGNFNRIALPGEVLSNTTNSPINEVTLTIKAPHDLGVRKTYVVQKEDQLDQVWWFLTSGGVTTKGSSTATGILTSQRPEPVNARVWDGDDADYRNRPNQDVFIYAGRPAEVTDAYYSGKGLDRDGDQLPQIVFKSANGSQSGLNKDDDVLLVKGLGDSKDRVIVGKFVEERSDGEMVISFAMDVFSKIARALPDEEFTYADGRGGLAPTIDPLPTLRKDYKRYDIDAFANYKTLIGLKTLAPNLDLAGWTVRSFPIYPGAPPELATPAFKDRKGTFWLYRGPHSESDRTVHDEVQIQWFYPVLAEFDFPGQASLEGFVAPYLRENVGTDAAPVYHGAPYLTPINTGSNAQHQHLADDRVALNVTYQSKWPSNPPMMQLGETITEARNGLPQIRGNTSLQILYQQSEVQVDPATKMVSGGGGESVRLFDPTREKMVALDRIPDSVQTSLVQGLTFFPGLPPHLSQRVFFDSSRGEKGALVLRGVAVDQTLAPDYLLLNVLTGSDLQKLKDLCSPNDSQRMNWENAVDGLTTVMQHFSEDLSRPGTFIPQPGLSKTIGVGDVAIIDDDDVAVDSYALSAPGPGTGYVTLISGNGRAFTPSSEPVSLKVLKVMKQQFAGGVTMIPSSNPLDEQISFLHVADLGGKFADYNYQWRIASPVDGRAPALDFNSDDPGDAWQTLTDGLGMNLYLLGGTGVQALSDNYIIARYQPTNPSHPLAGIWTSWSSPQLAEGWIKRVLAGINPFNQRISDLFGHSVELDTSVLTEAGSRWEGDVALNLENVDEHGLIEIYETVLNRGKKLSIDAGIDFGPANDALLLAAGYLNDLYMLLGDEALADLSDPTISIGSDHGEFADVATSLYSFKGQVPSLLEEELALLRGRDDFQAPGVQLSPVYNRLIWNYTRGIDAGEVVYALNYNISEGPGKLRDGVINAEDAAHQYPQGHGDAYGHYLTALKGYYKLLVDPDFTWVPRVESVNVLNEAVQVDYQDERKFAAAAVAFGRAGALALRRTWQRDYQIGHPSGWSHFSPERSNPSRSYIAPDPADSAHSVTNSVTRHWGVDHWATRVAQGGFINWVVGNAMLPDKDEDPAHEGIQKIDRGTVPELTELTALGKTVQRDLDNAEAGLNPLGIPEGGLAFDIDPVTLSIGNPTARASHFEQIYHRAVTALENAVLSFESARSFSSGLDGEANRVTQLQDEAAAIELGFKHRLIELYGTPYPDDIGPGKTYAQGYDGPDLLHYMLIDRSDLNARVQNVFEPHLEREFLLDQQTSGIEFNRIGDIRDDIELDEFFGSIKTKDLTKEGPGEDGVRFNMVAKNLTWENKDYKNGDFVSYTLGPDGTISIPSNWKSRRASPGQLQKALSDIVVAHNAAARSLESHELLKYKLDRQIEVFESQNRKHQVVREWRNVQLGLGITLKAAKVAFAAAEQFFDTVLDVENLTVDLIRQEIPDIEVFGLASGGDLLAGVKAGLFGAKIPTRAARGSVALGNLIAGGTLDLGIAEQGNLIEHHNILPAEWEFEQKKQVFELDMSLRDLQMSLFDVFEKLELLNAAHSRYRTFLAEGERIQKEREVQRNILARKVQGFRTRDVALRVFRNEKLSRYETLFNLAAHYTFLAAQAYDYETGLLDSPKGREFMQRIVNARALGVVNDGLPQDTAGDIGDPGLSSVLAELHADWSVLKGRLGFNNPDTHGTTVSLRTERYRIVPGQTGDSNWQTLLRNSQVDDLLADTDVRRFCAQIERGAGLSVPGFVLPFSTTIENGLNLFGHSLAAGDHVFSPTHFATKIFSVGVVFEGYRGGSDPSANANVTQIAAGGTPEAPSVSFLDSSALSATPYVYLIPVGSDLMRTPPLGGQTNIRSWSVRDVTIPLPFNLGASSFSRPSLFQSADALSEPLYGLRKHQAFRAMTSASVFSEGGELIPSGFTNGRLIGRSIWNSQWKLVIPGHALLADPKEGMDRFVQSVTDVKLHFVTYSYAGN